MKKITIVVSKKIQVNNAKPNAQSIEEKVREITEQNGRIDVTTVPPIYTDKKDGVLAGLDIRTDRFDVALEAANKIEAMVIAKREAAAKEVTPTEKTA